MRAIRLATAADIDAIIAIAPAGAERRAAIAEWVAAGHCHVVWQDDTAIGYAALTRGFFHSPFIELLLVSPRFRRQGIGRGLVQHCIALTPPDEKLWTSTNRSNAPMHALLPPLGFIRAGQVDHLDEGDPEIFYVRLPGPAV